MEDKTFYNLEEAARELDVSVEELKSMISFGKLPEVSDDGERLIPAQAVNDFYKSGASPAKSTVSSADHYTDTEVARKLRKPVSQIWRMADWGQLPAKRDEDGRRTFPKLAIDQIFAGNLTSNGTKQREEKSGEEYFTLEQISHALQRNVSDVKREAKTETLNEQTWVSRKEAERIISRREPLRQKRIRKRLPKPHRIGKPNIAAHKTGESSMKTVGKRKYYSLEEAAQFLGESVGDVWERIRKKQIPHENIKGQVCIPVLPLQDFLYDGKKVGVPTESSTKEVENLENKLQTKKAENEALRTSLKKEKIRREKATENFETQLTELRRDKQSTITALNSELEKLKLEKKRLASSLHDEHRRRVEAVNNVDELRLRAEEANNPLSGLGRSIRGIINPAPDSERIKELEDENEALKVTMRTNEAYLESDLNREREERKLDIRYERDRFEAEMENLRRDSEGQAARIEKEKGLREDAQRRAQEYYSELEQLRDSRETLNHSEAERKKLDNALNKEIEKVRRLEADASLLTEIRNLLGTSFEKPEEAAEAAPSPPPPPEGVEEKPDAPKPLDIKTHSGETVIFRPPFPLDSREVELIELVAGEDEITAEQIKARINRRAADDLDDLLDRLHDEGLEPITEDNDVYRFDPNFLDNVN